MIRTSQDGKGAIVAMEKPGLEGFATALMELHSHLGVMSVVSACVRPGAYEAIRSEIEPEDVREDGLAIVEMKMTPTDPRQPTESWRILVGPNERVEGNDVIFRLAGWH